jgi:CubicO group peptidase (beta-lactamase class C family)
MERSTFLRADVPPELAASPHVALPLVVPGDSYPYTRRHAPSSSLHSNVVEMCRWIQGLLDPADPELVRRMWEPVVDIDDPPWEESQSLGWGIGTWRGHRLATHSGMDPGFRSLFAVVPGTRTGVVVLANSNTVPAYRILAAAFEVAADGAPGEAVAELLTTLRTHAGPVAAVLADAGPEAAAEYHRLATADPPEVDVEWEGIDDAAWGAIELHRTELVWPLLRLWA